MGNSGYDVLHYDLHVTVDMEGEKIQAKAAIQAVATENLGRFNLDLWGLTVDAVSVDGESAAFDHQEGELIITPPSGLPEGKSFTGKRPTVGIDKIPGRMDVL
jgi:aminopeptidase N